MAQRNRKERIAKVTVRYLRVKLRPPFRQVSARSKDLEPIEVTAILVREEKPPVDEVPLEWLLLTNLPVTTKEQAIEKILWYTLRWSIEQYHRVMKSGFKVESSRLRSAGRLNRFISLISVLAIRIFAMTHLARNQAKDSCETVLDTNEWRALHCKINRKQTPPQKPPSLETAILWVAILGGYLARKQDLPPGPTVIWRGWKKLTEITDDWILFSKRCG